MKLLLTSIIFFSFFESSFAYKVELEELDPPPMRIYDPIWDYTPITGGTISYSDPSAEEIALTAKLDSQEVQINLLYQTLDSTRIILNKQKSSIKKLERTNAENKTEISKQQHQREEESRKSMWVISFLGITAALGVFFVIRFTIASRKAK